MRIEKDVAIEVDQDDDPQVRLHIDKKKIIGTTVTIVPYDFTVSSELTFIVKDKIERADDDPSNFIYKKTTGDFDVADAANGNLIVALSYEAVATARVKRCKLISTEGGKNFTVLAGPFIVRDT